MYTVAKANFLDYEEYTFHIFLIEKHDYNAKQVLLHFESTEIWHSQKHLHETKFHQAKGFNIIRLHLLNTLFGNIHKQILPNTFKCTNRNITYQLNLPKCPSTDHLHHFIIFSFHAQISHFIYRVFIYIKQNSHFIYNQFN